MVDLTEAAANSDQNFIVPGGRLFNFFTFEDLGRTIAVINNGFHGFLSESP
jgi:hypothetical protein